jgi:hypothetical protein
MDGYVSKPIRTHELFAAIEEAIARYTGQNASHSQPAESTTSVTKGTPALAELKAKL